MGVSIVTMAEVLNLISDQVHKRLPAYICVANVHTTVLSQHDDELCKAQNESLLTIPDGMPLVWYARLIGNRRVERVTGPDLMIKILEISGQHGYSHYFYGDTKQVLTKLRTVISHRYPGTEVKGMCSPPFRQLTENEISNTIDDINKLQPTFVWIALGGPKQEKWMAKVFPYIDSAIMVGVGAAFRFVIGEYKHPPKLIQKCGLEGVFWRTFKHPIDNGKWLCYLIPAFGTLMFKGLAQQFLDRHSNIFKNSIS